MGGCSSPLLARAIGRTAAAAAASHSNSEFSPCHGSSSSTEKVGFSFSLEDFEAMEQEYYSRLLEWDATECDSCGGSTTASASPASVVRKPCEVTSQNDDGWPFLAPSSTIGTPAITAESSRAFIFHLEPTPGSQLSEQFNANFAKVRAEFGEDETHFYHPHCSLTSFFRVRPYAKTVSPSKSGADQQAASAQTKPAAGVTAMDLMTDFRLISSSGNSSQEEAAPPPTLKSSSDEGMFFFDSLFGAELPALLHGHVKKHFLAADPEKGPLLLGGCGGENVCTTGSFPSSAKLISVRETEGEEEEVIVKRFNHQVKVRIGTSSSSPSSSSLGGESYRRGVLTTEKGAVIVPLSVPKLAEGGELSVKSLCTRIEKALGDEFEISRLRPRGEHGSSSSSSSSSTAKQQQLVPKSEDFSKAAAGAGNGFAFGGGGGGITPKRIDHVSLAAGRSPAEVAAIAEVFREANLRFEGAPWDLVLYELVSFSQNFAVDGQHSFREVTRLSHFATS